MISAGSPSARLGTLGAKPGDKVGDTPQVQIKDSGLTLGIDDETSPFLAVKVFFRVLSRNRSCEELIIKETLASSRGILF